MKPWLDFSGAPVLIVPSHLVPIWRGCTDPDTGEHAYPNFESPRTDFDRAAAALLSPVCAILPVGGSAIIALALDADHIRWDAQHLLVVDHSEPPSTEGIERAAWREVGRYRSERPEHVLMNAAGDGAALTDDEWMPISLPVGELIIEFARINDGEYSAMAHRIRPNVVT